MRISHIVTIWQQIYATFTWRKNVVVFVHFPPQSMCLNAFDGAGMEEYADIESGAAEVVEVKTGADSGFKQVKTESFRQGLFGGIPTAIRRRDIAGNGTYTCDHEIADLLPPRTTGSTLKAVAGTTQCVERSQPATDARFAFAVCGTSERSSLKC
ncbi:hypothetical protein [Agrobacterium larrymoorei]|uniref:hypothetical protein n=1 Tax=Agrobacterium larrymoorei TaxID=160699 RepID=UPI0030BF6C39